MLDRITIKRGDSLALDCTAWLTPPKGADAGIPRDVNAWTPGCQMRHERTGRRISLSAKPSGAQAAQGRFVLSAQAADTQAWPTGCWHADIQFTSAGVVTSTDTFIIHVLEDITP